MGVGGKFQALAISRPRTELSAPLMGGCVDSRDSPHGLDSRKINFTSRGLNFVPPIP